MMTFATCYLRRAARPASPRSRLRLEALESRNLLSAGELAFNDAEPNDVLNAAQQLDVVSESSTLAVTGAVGNGASARADVDWYQFHVDQTSRVRFALNGPAELSLYNTDPDSAPFGHRLAVRGTAAFDRALLPGRYFVAVSGAGNRYFHPYLADSGTEGATGAYRLTVSAEALSAGPGLRVLESDIPAAGFASSPGAIHLTLSEPVDLAGLGVRLRDRAGNERPAQVSYHADTQELAVIPAGALAVGDYRVVIVGAAGNDLITAPFRVNGREGRPGMAAVSDDTPGAATDLRDVTGRGLAQFAGRVGDNPAYSGAEGGRDVDLYQFTVSGGGRKALVAEAFAGRIGSPLDAALTLFRLETVAGSSRWVVVAGNNNANNPVLDSRGRVVLLSDPLLISSLTAGRYLLVVSNAEAGSEPLFGRRPGMLGRFDPNVVGSAGAGATTGDYVLNLYVTDVESAPPTVLGSSLDAGVVEGDLTKFTVRFSRAIALGPLLFQTDVEDGGPKPVFITDAAGRRFFPRLIGYDVSRNEATFRLLDQLADGQFTLHLSGAAGLTDVTGLPLAGEAQIGFTVRNNPLRPANRTVPSADDSFANPTSLGVLYAHDLARGVNVRRDFRAAGASDNADYFRFTITQGGLYRFGLSNTGDDALGRPILLGADGNELTPRVDPRDPINPFLIVRLPAGSYTIKVTGWDPANAAAALYDLRVSTAVVEENPVPLNNAPVPAYRLQLFATGPRTPNPAPGQPAPVMPPVVTTPPASPGVPANPVAPPQLVLPTRPDDGIRFVAINKPSLAVPLALDGVSGGFAGLAAAPPGLQLTGDTRSAPVRLVLPGADLGANTHVALRVDADTLAREDDAERDELAEAILREFVLIGMSWLKAHFLIPGVIVGTLQPGLGEDAQPAVARALGDVPPADVGPEQESAVSSAAMALALAGLVGEVGRKRRVHEVRPMEVPRPLRPT